MTDFTLGMNANRETALYRPVTRAFGYEATLYIPTEQTPAIRMAGAELSNEPIVLKSEVVRAVAALQELGRLPTLQPGSKAERRRRKAAAKRANTLTNLSIKKVEAYIAEHSRSHASDLLKFRLSLRGGLRAGEISALRVEDMLSSNGSISDTIEVRTLKQRYSNRTRHVDMHPDIREALAQLLADHPTATHVAFSVGRDGKPRYQSASCVTNWFHRLYKNAGLLGCSSHSGRRTFATDVARQLPAHQGSLRDLQIVMGHARIGSTECYLEPSDKMGQIIRSLGS